MKKEWYRAIAAVLAVTLTVSTIAACGRSHKEPADSLRASETFVPATVQEMEDDELNEIVKEVAGDDWDGDYSKLTSKQRSSIQEKLTEKGYNVTVTDNGITYFSYTPTADESEIAEAVKTVLGDKEWSGEYDDLDDDEKIAVRDELRDRGYDVEVGMDGFNFMGEADRKEQITKFSYNLLPTQEQIIGAVADVIGSSDALKWDGNMLSLTEQQRKDVLKKLNNYGFDLALNDAGEFYMIHDPSNKVTYATAYTPMVVNGTTQAPTTVVVSEENKETDNLTGTTASSTIPAPVIERTALSTFGGTGGDSFQHVAASKDGGYIVTANFLSADGDYADTDKTWKRQKSAVVKYDKNGTFQWKAASGGKNLFSDAGVILNQSAELNDGSIVAVGTTGAKNLGAKDVMDALMICYNADGSQKWLKLVSGTQGEEFSSVCATPDGGFLVGGRTRSSDGDFDGLTVGSVKAILIKYDADGTQKWIRSLNSGTNAASFNALAVTDQGYIYAACYSPVALGRKTQLDMLQFAGYGGADSIIFKFDPNGELLNHRTIAGSGNDQVTSLALANGGVIVGGVYTSNARNDSVFAGKHNYGSNDAFLIRLNETLDVQWVKTFGGADSEIITGVAQIKGGYAAVGWSRSKDGAFDFLGIGESDAFVLTVSENGSDVQKTALNGTKRDQALGVVSNGNKQLAVVGNTLSTTNHFSNLTPASTGLAVSYFSLFRVK